MSPDVVIVGGGAIGLSAAYQLARDGARVRVLERRALGAGASGCSAALLEYQTDTDRHPALFRLAGLSREMFPALEAEIRALTGRDFGFEACGIVTVALSADDAAALREKADRHRAAGLRVDWMTNADLEAAMPQLDRRNEGGAVFREDGQVNPERFLAALAAAARAAGAEIVENAGDISLTDDGGRVLARAADGREHPGDLFVVAAGAWSGAVLAPLGVELPFQPVRGQLAVYDSPTPDLPMPVYTRDGGYLAPKHSHLLVGSTVERVGFDDSTTEDGRAALASRRRRLLADAPGLSFRGTTAGLRPGTPDLLPVIGFLPGRADVVVAAGHYRNGILLAPITGRLVRDLAMKRELPMDLSAFAAERFLPAVESRESGI